MIPLLTVWLALAGCGHREPPVDPAREVEARFARLRSCVDEERVENKLKIALVGVTVNPNETLVRIVAYALDEAIDFDLPVYRFSSGRWLINEKFRAYLVDEECNQYKLKDRGYPSGQPMPQNGRVRLNPGQAFEATLSFPRLPNQTRMGVLVYGERRLPFVRWEVSQ